MSHLFLSLRPVRPTSLVLEPMFKCDSSVLKVEPCGWQLGANIFPSACISTKRVWNYMNCGLGENARMNFICPLKSGTTIQVYEACNVALRKFVCVLPVLICFFKLMTIRKLKLRAIEVPLAPVVSSLLKFCKK